MLLERAEISIRDGAAEAFAAVLRGQALPILAAIPGVGSIRFGRGVEDPDKYLLLVEWESMAAHTAFTRMPVFADFRALLMPFSTGGAMEHFEID